MSLRDKFLVSLFWKIGIEKVNVSAYQSILIGFITYLLEEDKSPQEINEILKKVGAAGVEKQIMEYTERKPFPKDLSEFAKAADLWIKMYAGKYFDKIYMDISEDGRKISIHWILKDNILSKGIDSPNLNIKMDSYIAGIIEGAAIVGADYMEETKKGYESIKCDEIRCRATGDEHCEFVLEVRLEDEATKIVREKYKERRIVFK